MVVIVSIVISSSVSLDPASRTFPQDSNKHVVLTPRLYVRWKRSSCWSHKQAHENRAFNTMSNYGSVYVASCQLFKVVSGVSKGKFLSERLWTMVSISHQCCFPPEIVCYVLLLRTIPL